MLAWVSPLQKMMEAERSAYEEGYAFTWASLEARRNLRNCLIFPQNATEQVFNLNIDMGPDNPDQNNNVENGPVHYRMFISIPLCASGIRTQNVSDFDR